MAKQHSRIAYAACPLCGGRDFPVVVQGDCSEHHVYSPVISPVIDWCGCTACGHIFTSGHFAPKTLDVLFSKTNENQLVGYDMERQRIVSGPMVAKVAARRPEGAWLDVGFGNASLLFTADEWGYEAVGLDLRRANVEAVRSVGIEAHCQDMTKFDHPGRFSVVSMMDVLEHMPFPKQGLAAAHKLLQPGGILFLSMPNADSMLWRVLNSKGANPYWNEVEHCHNFGRKRLYALLAECGFRPVEYGLSIRYRLGMEVLAERCD